VKGEADAHSATPTYTSGKESPAREPSWSAFSLQKPCILRVCVREEDAGGREDGEHSTTPTYTSGKESPVREQSWSAFWFQKPSILRVCVREEDTGGREAGEHSTAPKYTAGKDSPAREPSWSAFWLQKPSILCVCVREEDAGGREEGAPSDLKMPLENENGRADDERVSRGQASERAVMILLLLFLQKQSLVCERDCICREGGTPSSAACRHRVPARRPPRHNGRVFSESVCVLLQYLLQSCSRGGGGGGGYHTF
jgi:hypothetical protein